MSSLAGDQVGGFHHPSSLSSIILAPGPTLPTHTALTFYFWLQHHPKSVAHAQAGLPLRLVQVVLVRTSPWLFSSDFGELGRAAWTAGKHLSVLGFTPSLDVSCSLAKLFE